MAQASLPDLQEGEDIVFTVRKSPRKYWLDVLVPLPPGWLAVWMLTLSGLFLAWLISFRLAHHLTAYLGLALATVLITFALVFARHAWATYRERPFAQWDRERHFVTQSRLIYSERGRIESVPLAIIQDISYATSSLARVLDYGDLAVQPAGHPPITLADIHEPSKAQLALVRQIDLLRSLQRTAADEILDKIRRLFVLSLEEGEEEVRLFVRKHWWWLLASLFRPTLLYVLLIMALTLLEPTSLGAALGLSGLPLLARLAAPFLLASSWGLWSCLSWPGTALIVTSDRVTLVERKPLIYEHRREVALRFLLNASYEVPSNLARVLGFGTVTVTFHSVGPDSLQFQYAPNAQEIKSLINALAVEVWRSRMAKLASRALESHHNTIRQYGLSRLLEELKTRLLSDEQYADWISHDKLRLSRPVTPSTVRIEQIEGLDSISISVSISLGDILLVESTLGRLGLKNLLLQLSGISQQSWSSLVTISLPWLKAWSAPNEYAFRAAVREIVQSLCSTLGISFDADETAFGHKQLWYTFVLNVSQPFAGTRLQTLLPFVFLRRRELLESDLPDLQHILSHHRVALLTIFTEEAAFEQATRVLEQMRAVYAYDIILMTFNELQQVVAADDPHRSLRQLVLPRVNLVNVSPFTDTGPTPDDMFVGREHELREIAEHAIAKWV